VTMTRYSVKRAWGSNQRRVRITLTRRASYGYILSRFTMGVTERALIKALRDAGYHVVTDVDLPKVGS
jgi:hypothetical protein